MEKVLNTFRGEFIYSNTPRTHYTIDLEEIEQYHLDHFNAEVDSFDMVCEILDRIGVEWARVYGDDEESVVFEIYIVGTVRRLKQAFVELQILHNRHS